MRTKLTLPLVALAVLAAALPASAQEPTDGRAIMALDDPCHVYVDDGTFLVSRNPFGAHFATRYEGVVIESAAPAPPEAAPNDIAVQRIRPV